MKDWKKLKDLCNFLVPTWWTFTIFPHKESIFKDLKKAKKMLEEMGV